MNTKGFEVVESCGPAPLKDDELLWLSRLLCERRDSVVQVEEEIARRGLDERAFLLSLEPRILYLIDFLSAEEVDRLITNTGFTPSKYLHSDRYLDGRKSESFYFSEDKEEIRDVRRRLALLTRTAENQSEIPELVRYLPGHKFGEHVDYFDSEDPASLPYLTVRGQRVFSAVAYLSTAFSTDAGGSTRFPAVGLEVLPQKGDLLIWRNVDFNSVPDPRTVHESTELREGVKHILVSFINQGLGA